MIKATKPMNNTPHLLKLPKIVFFDIDDTLYIKEQNAIAPRTAHALKQLKASGIIPAIATGRGICVFPTPIRQLIGDVGIELFVTINGQYNEFHGKKLIDFPLSLEQLQNTTKELKRLGLAYAYMTRDEIIALNPTPLMMQALGSLNIPYRVADDFDFSTPVYQMLAFFADGSVDLALMDNLKTVRWHQYAIDILDNHGSKARGIGEVLNKLGLDFSDAMAFGDGLNDIEMLQTVGFGVAMGNAYKATKDVADFVCPRHDEDGIYAGLKMLGLIDQLPALPDDSETHHNPHPE